MRVKVLKKKKSTLGEHSDLTTSLKRKTIFERIQHYLVTGHW